MQKKILCCLLNTIYCLRCTKLLGIFALIIKNRMLMETSKNLFWNKAMFWGFVTALASMLSITIFYSTDNFFAKPRAWVDIAIIAAGIVICGLTYRQSLSEKEPFTYPRALGLGMATILFASLIMGVFYFVLYKFIDPELIDEMLAQSEEVLLNSGLSDDMVEQQIEMSSKFMNPAFMSISSIFSYLFYGFIVSLISSIFLKKKQHDGYAEIMSELDEA